MKNGFNTDSLGPLAGESVCINVQMCTANTK